ncbi:MAG TPA: SAM-dependent methyltransferase [Opitutaceae bacterium]
MSSPPSSPRDRFLELLRASVHDATLVKLTLGKHRGADATLQNLYVRPVSLKAGPHLSFVWRHATRDITKNHPPAEALALLEPLIGGDFLDAHLFTPVQTAQLACADQGPTRLKITVAAAAPPAAPDEHDRAKHHAIPTDAPWLRALGITNERGQPREGASAKFRQIQKFTELLAHLAGEAGFTPDNEQPPTDSLDTRPEASPLRVLDAGCGKGYLTFATAALFGPRATVRGIEMRRDLVELCNRIAKENGFAHLAFETGDIASAETGPLDVLIALHACDTATDDALAKGIDAGATLLVVSPCCQKELRPQLSAPPVLADALRHGIFQERQAEFVTDALRAQLLEWAGYRTKVFEFISTEHTAKNLMIAAVKARPRGTPDDALARRIRAFAAFYGLRTQRLAAHLGLPLGE